MDLMPHASSKHCPKNSHYKKSHDTCSCEDHCGWDICRLVNPPDECVEEVFSEWKWDIVKNGWVAQVVIGNAICNITNDIELSIIIHI